MTVKELRQLLKAHKQDEIIRLLPYYDEYNEVSCATLKIGDTTHYITKDYITRNSTSWFTSAEGSWSGNGSGAADITWTCKARSSAPDMLTFS